MIKRMFVVEEHEEYGTKGFRPKWMPQADPLGGMAVAHDILEHFPKDDGGVEAELQALGAALYIRGNGGYWWESHNTDPAYHVAGDFIELYRHCAYENFTLLDPGRTTRLDDEEAERWCQNAARDGLRSVHEEVSHLLVHMRDNEDSEFLNAFCSDQTRLRVVGWLRKGYRRARKRYVGADPGIIVHSIFKPIAKTADKWLERGAEEGMLLEVSVNLRSGDVTMKGGYPPDPYYDEPYESMEELTLIY
jgi:hypothetical protein